MATGKTYFFGSAADRIRDALTMRGTRSALRMLDNWLGVLAGIGFSVVLLANGWPTLVLERLSKMPYLPDWATDLLTIAKSNHWGLLAVCVVSAFFAVLVYGKLVTGLAHSFADSRAASRLAAGKELLRVDFSRVLILALMLPSAVLGTYAGVRYEPGILGSWMDEGLFFSYGGYVSFLLVFGPPIVWFVSAMSVFSWSGQPHLKRTSVLAKDANSMAVLGLAFKGQMFGYSKMEKRAEAQGRLERTVILPGILGEEPRDDAAANAELSVQHREGREADDSSRGGGA